MYTYIYTYISKIIIYLRFCLFIMTLCINTFDSIATVCIENFEVYLISWFSRMPQFQEI